MMLGMNKLALATRAQILAMLCEGASMRSVSRLTDTSINTVSKLLVDAGRFCAGFHDAKVRGVKASKVQVDEIWSFVGREAKECCRHEKRRLTARGTLGLGPRLKPIRNYSFRISWAVAMANAPSGLSRIWHARLANRVQLTSDGHKAYLEAVEGAFGCDIDYAMLVKMYGNAPETFKGRYSPAECTGIKKTPIEGKPDLAHVSTSYVERQNLTVRMHNRRFTRLTNAFSKKFENHAHMVAIYAVWYNWIRIHKTLRVTPAMAAGISKTVMDWSDIVEMMDADQPTKKRGPYKKAVEEISN